MWVFNDWHDGLRVAAIVSCAISLAFLLRRSRRTRDEWNTKTRDLWYAMIMWCVAGFVLGVEGIYEDRGLDPRLIFYVAASIVTLKGLCSKDEWGGHD